MSSSSHPHSHPHPHPHSHRGSGLSDEARAVHAAAIPIDLHADTTKLMSRGYDFYQRHDPPWPVRSFFGHVDLPRMREGNHRAQFFGMWTFPKPERGCTEDVHRQIDALEATIARGDSAMVLCRSADDVRTAKERGQVAALLGIEGGQALGRGTSEQVIERLTTFARRGVRYLGLLHFSQNALGYPQQGWGRDHEKGLTPIGCEVVDACRRSGVLVDLAHINHRGFFEVVERRPGPLFVTHTGVLGVQRHWRNIDDDQIHAVAESGGVVGVIFAPRYLGQDGIEGVVAHLSYLVRVAGEDHVGIGSDWDGAVRPPKGLESPAKLPHLTEALLRAGFSATTVHKILGENVLRVLSSAPPMQFV
ncbi:MAG: dipeptidase [Myxococcales bacterium]|nr:dipeptidase [Myxococcales bacterium]